MSNVEIRELGVRYGSVRVLEELTLDIPSSEFLVLLGPSGCGKSTLLNAIAGLQPVSSGKILIGGHDMTRVEPKDRNIAMVFQSYALYPRMSVRGNLSFGLKNARVPKAEIAKRIEAVAEMLQIGDLLDRRPAELSGGQRQRVAIGRAVVREAGVFLFDEPLSNLDAQLRADLRVEIKRLHKRLKATMIYVTHDQVEAMTLADRIAIMKDRVIQQLGTPDEIYGRPVNTFVARFVGSPAINFIQAVATDDVEVVIGGAKLPVTPDAAGNWETGRTVTVGIRPEHLQLSLTETGGPQAEIEIIEPLGPEKLIWLRFEEQTLCARVSAEQKFAPGDTVRLVLPREHIHLFDITSGMRI